MADPRAMIKISKLTKSYFDHKVVDDLSLEIKQGSLFGFLGPNGAGKTTTMKMIVGLLSPDHGSITIDGHDLSDLKSREKIGYMPEDPYFYERLNALEFLQFMASLFPRNVIPAKAGIHAVDSGSQIKSGMTLQDKQRNSNPTIKQLNILLTRVGLESVGRKRIGDFSKGMKQRLGLAQALVNDPEYLFLDEPLDGLDPIGRLEFKEIFLNLKKQGKTIFFNSHILPDVEEICDEIGVINDGKLIYSGSVKSFCKNNTLEKQFVKVITSP